VQKGPWKGILIPLIPLLNKLAVIQLLDEACSLAIQSANISHRLSRRGKVSGTSFPSLFGRHDLEFLGSAWPKFATKLKDISG
jgi:hypothetical protein